jgi:ketosteroid isomerase-like protein
MNQWMLKILSFFCVFSILLSCSPKKKSQEPVASLKALLIQADQDFSKLSETKGMKTAFMKYIDSNGVLLRPGSMPLTGGDAIDYISQGNDTSFVMTWDPKGCKLSESGELGYTYGVYSIRPNGKDTVLHGTYITVWQKQPDGKWKFVLDSGNDGIGE